MTSRMILRMVVAMLFVGNVAVSASEFDWQTAKEPYPGIRVLKKKYSKPRLMRVAVMRIDLETPGLRFVTTGRDADWGKPMPDYPKITIATKRITTAEFMRQANRGKRENGMMIAAFNAAPWVPWEKPFTHKYGTPLGLNISDGIVVSDNHPELPAFVVWKNGGVDILETVDRKKTDRIREAVSGFCMIAKNGRLLPNARYSKPPMPRMAYGLSQDRRYLYVIAIDGRQKKWSLGASGRETGKILLDAGAWDVINMDGGGSATLCVWDKRKKQPTALNRHNAKGYLRPVGSNVGVVIERSR